MKQFKVPTIFSAIDKVSSVMKGMQTSVHNFVNRSEADIARFERKWRGIGALSLNVAKKSAMIGLAIAAPLVVAAHNAIQFEDRMADISKTTGLVGKGLDDLGAGILSMSMGTRTSIEELQKIGAIGGAMGVAQKDLLSFTDSVNKFNVALGSDFGGVESASRAISGLKVLFKETRDINVADAITKTGSSINALSAKGVNVPEITEFITRVGALPDAIKPSIQSTAALAATLNKAGIAAEISSRAFADILLTGAQNLPKFAKQMHLTNKEASNLINSNPTEFAVKFSKSLSGLSAEKLALTLKKLKLTDAGSIKVVGALASSTKILTEFQKIANDEFAKGTSLLNEYNTKNETTAAKLKRAANSFEAFSIILGQELLPVINKVIMKVLPLMKSMINWAKENPNTLKTIVGLTVGLSALSFVVSGVSSAIWLVSKAMLATTAIQWLWATAQAVTLALQGKTILFLQGNTTAMIAYKVITGAVTAAQWLWNAAMAANPIGAIILGIAAMVAIITVVIVKWNDWGAAISVVMGPLGMVISMIQSFRRNWDMVTNAFTKGGILAGIKAIGRTILDSLIMPVQQLIGLIGKITGIQSIKNLAKVMDIYRKGIGVNTTTDESGSPLNSINALSNQSEPKEAVNPKAVEREIMREEFKSFQQFNSKLLIEDKTGRAKLDGDNPNISLTAPKVGSTHNGF
jgi:TP901 family phage tail tape measure protein